MGEIVKYSLKSVCLIKLFLKKSSGRHYAYLILVCFFIVSSKKRVGKQNILEGNIWQNKLPMVFTDELSGRQKILMESCWKCNLCIMSL